MEGRYGWQSCCVAEADLEKKAGRKYDNEGGEEKATF